MDDSFGPRLFGHFDFTLLFEHVIFQTIPSVIILFSVPFYIYKAIHTRRLARSGWLLWAKLAAAAAIVAVQLAILVCWYRSPLNSRLARAASFLSLLSSLAVCLITYASHSLSLQPIPFLSIYLSVTLVLDLVTVYTYFNRNGLTAIAWLSCALPILKFGLVILEEFSKRSLLIAEEVRNSIGNEGLAGFWSRSTFMWINPLLLFGFKNQIRNEQLPDIGLQFDSVAIHERFNRAWSNQDKTKKYALLKALIFSMPWPLFYLILPRLLQVGFQLGQPFLLQDVVNVLSSTRDEQAASAQSGVIPKEKKIGLIIATLLLFSGRAISKNWFGHIRNQIVASIRAALVSAIYCKSLKLPATESEHVAAVTLMTADVIGIDRLVTITYNSFAMIIEALLGISILSVLVGPASIFTVITTAAVSVAARRMAGEMNNTQRRWNEHIQERVATTSNILAQIKEVKMLGLAPSMAAHLQRLQDQEVEVYLSDRKIIATTFGISALTETITPVVVVAGALFWTRPSDLLSAARFFTVLAVISLSTDPMASFFSSLPSWSSSLACMSRIQAYLNRPERTDARLLMEPEPQPSSSSQNAPGLRNRNAPSAPIQFAVRLENVNVTDDLAGSILRDLTAYIRAGEVSMMIGSVGCGKTTVLNAILGEARLRSGSVLISSRDIALAGQKPFLINATIRVNIVGQCAYNHERYTNVLYICDLEIDLEALADGDQTVVGDNGVVLSGGQKQRISLARALYFDADITILDDPFSSLDKETATNVRIRLFSDGYATEGGKTLIMTTSMRQHLVDADNAFRVTDEGRMKLLTAQEVREEVDAAVRQSAQTLLATAISTKGTNEPPPMAQASEPARVPESERQPRRRGLFLYAFYFLPAGIAKILTWLLLIAGAAVSQKVPSIYVREWLEKAPDNRRYYIGYVIVSCLYPILNLASAMFFFFYVNSKTSRALHQVLVKTVFNAEFEFLINEDAGSLVNRFSNDISVSSERVANCILPSVFRAISILVDIGIISAGASYAAPVIPFLLIVIFAIQGYYLQTSVQVRHIELDVSKLLVGLFTETGYGIEHIRAFGWEEELVQQFHSLFTLVQRPFYFLLCIQQWLECVLDFSVGITATALVTLALEYPSTASANSIGLALLSLIGLSDRISIWVKSSVAMETALGAVERIWSYSTTTPQEQYDKETPPLQPDWPAQGIVELNSVTPEYQSRNGGDPHKPVRNATAIIRPGQSLAIVGRTGGGKSSIHLSILNLLRYRGTISIDDREIRTIPPDVLRSRMTIITQGGVYLRGSVRFNLDPFDPALRPPNYIMTDWMQQGVLRRVGLWHIVSARGGLSARMSDMNFSHGQKQLFQIARAVLHKQVTRSKIVLIDEATSGLDYQAEEGIADLLDEVCHGCVRIEVTHRGRTQDNADAVMLVENGVAALVRHTPGMENWTFGNGHQL